MPATKTESGLWLAKAYDGLLTSATSRDARAALAVYRSIVLGDGPVAYWRLAETSGASFADETSNQVASLGAGSVTYALASALLGDPADRSMGFDGSTSKVNVPFNAVLYPGQTFSVEGWYKFPLAPTTNTPIYDCRPASSGATAAGYDLFLGITGVGLSVCANNVAQTIISQTPVGGYTTGVWHHAVGTYDGTQSRLYLDGVLRAGPTTCTYTKNPTAVAGIGHLALIVGANVVNGQLDEVALYSTALSPNQVSNRYLAGLTALGAIATAREALV